jgi:RNA polymerase sigma-70 factor, ECF subfamily
MEQSGTQTDAAVVETILAGNAQAYALLVERYSPRLFGLAFHLSGDYDTASDLVQDTFITAYNCLDRLRRPAAFISWASTILRNKSRNLARRNPASVLSLDSLMEAGFEPASPTAPESEFDEDDTRRVMECVAELPAKYREILLLRHSEDLSYKEIAALSDESLSTITARLHQARKALIKQAKEKGLL